MDTTIYERAVSLNHPIGYGHQELVYSGFGLTGEAGEFAGEVKKYLRSWPTVPVNKTVLLDELGDTQYYLTRLALALGSNLNNVMDLHIAKLAARRMERRVGPI